METTVTQRTFLRVLYYKGGRMKKDQLTRSAKYLLYHLTSKGMVLEEEDCITLTDEGEKAMYRTKKSN